MPGRAFSVFSGIGALDLGLERAGWHVVAQCEANAYRRSILEARFGRPCYPDVRDVDGRAIELRGVGLLAGGFPCQDLSVAGARAAAGLDGARAGLDGARSGLFYEYARLAAAIRPDALLVENVYGLLSSRGGRDFGVVMGTLADLGYGLAWRILDSCYFGVPQRRRRLYLVGIRASDDPRAAAARAGEILSVGDRCARHPETSSGAREGDPAGARGGPARDGERSRVSGLTSKWRKGTGGPAGDETQNLVAYGPTEDEPVAFVAENQRAELRERGLASALGGGGGKPGQGYAMVRAPMAVRKLTPLECERLQGLPDHWTEPGLDGERYAAIGDAVTVPVAEWIGRRLLEA